MDETLNERLPYASRAVSALSAIAVYGYHLDLDPTTKQRWHAAMRAMRVTDSHADQPDNQDRLIHLLDILATLDEVHPDLAAEQLGVQRYSTLIRGAATIIKYGELLRTAPTPETYIATRAAEATATAGIITQLATDDVMNQPD
jgi:hypothetical protein